MSNAVDDLFKKTGMRTVGGGQSTTGNYTSTSGSSAGQGSAVDKLFASTGMKVSQVHSRSRESEIANSFANQTNQRKDKEGLYTNDQRDKLLDDLAKVHKKYSGSSNAMPIVASYNKEKGEIEQKLKALDKQLGNGDIDYSKYAFTTGERLGKILGSSVTGSAAGIADAAGTLLDYGASLNDRSSDVERAIADSDYSGWVTDELSLANAKKDYSEGRIKSAGVQNEVRRAATGLENWGATTADKSEQLLEGAKAGLGTFGRGAVDVTKGLFDVAGDTLLSAAAPGLGMVRMGTSAFGSAAREARQNGANVDRQMLMGLKSAGIEVLTEKIGGPFEKAYGKTVLGKSIEKGINKLAKESVWKKLALKGVSNFISEGGEEVLSNVLNVAVDNAIAKIDAGYYTKEANLMRQIGNMRSEIELARANGTVTREQETQLAILQGQLDSLHTSMAEKLEKVDISEALYEGLIGGLTGLVGGTANIRTDIATARAQNAVEATERRTEEVNQGKASDGTGIVKNLPVQGNTPQQRVYNLLSAINQDRAKEILNNAKYEQAFEDLTGIDPDTIKGADIDDRAEELVRRVQEAAGTQETQGGEITPPTPTEAATQPPDALNSNSRENEAPQTDNSARIAQLQEGIAIADETLRTNLTPTQRESFERRRQMAVDELMRLQNEGEGPVQLPINQDLAARLGMERDQITNQLNEGERFNQELGAERTVDEVVDLLANGGFPGARQIYDNPEYRRVYEALTGEKLPPSRKKAVNQIQKHSKSDNPLPNLGKIDPIDILLGGDGRIVQEQAPVEEPAQVEQVDQTEPEAEETPAPDMPEQIPYEESVPLQKNEIKAGTRVVNKNGRNGTILATTGRKVYVKFDGDNSGNAREYLIGNFVNHFNLAERVQVESAEDGSVGELSVDDVINEVNKERANSKKDVADIEGAESLREIAEPSTEKASEQTSKPKKVRSARDLALLVEGLDEQEARRVLEEQEEDLSRAEIDAILREYGKNPQKPVKEPRKVVKADTKPAAEKAVERADKAITEAKDAAKKEENREHARKKLTEAVQKTADKQQLRQLADELTAAGTFDGVEQAKFMQGQGSYADYPPQTRADILNLVNNTDQYYVKNGEVLKERRYTTTRQENPNDRSTNLPSNFKKPGKAKTETVDRKLAPENVPYDEAAPIKPSDIKPNTRVVHKSGKNGVIAAVAGDAVYVKLDGKKEAEPFSRKAFDKFFKSAQRLTTDAEPAKVEDDVKVYKPKGETDNAVSERRDTRVRADNGGSREAVQGTVEGQNNGTNAGRDATRLEEKTQQENDRGLREDTGSDDSLTERRKAADGIKNPVLRKKVLQALDGIGRGKLAPDEARAIFKAQFAYAHTQEDKINLIKSAGGKVVDVNDAMSFVKSAVNKAQKRHPNTKCFVVDSDIMGVGQCGRDGTVYINQNRIAETAQKNGVGVDQIVEHEFQHSRFRKLGLDGEKARKWLEGTFGSETEVWKSIYNAFELHNKIFHKGESDTHCWEEVAVDFLSDNIRVCSDQDVFARVKKSLGQFMKLHEMSASLASGGKETDVKEAKYEDETWDDVDALLNGMDEENSEMQRREEQRKQDEFLELRDADKRTTNAKEWGQKQRQEQRNAELDNTVYDIERAVGGKRYSELRSIDHELDRATTIDAATKENPAARKFDTDTYKRASHAISAITAFSKGACNFKAVADAYESLKKEGAEFYDESLAERMKELADTIEQTERNSEKHDGKLPENLADDVVETLTMMSKRIQRGGEFGVKQKSQANNELASAKDQTSTGLTKTIEDMAKKFVGVQIRPETMFKVFGQFKNGVFSGLSEKSQNAVRHKINAQQAALEYFASVTKTKGYEAFATGKTTVENVIPDLEGDTMSTNMALSLLKILETDGALEHIREHGLVLPNNEKEVYNGLNNNGMGDRDSYAKKIDFMTDEVRESYRFADQSNDPKDIAHARASHEEAIKKARTELKAAIMADPVAKAMYEASSSCMQYLGRDINKTSRELWGVNFATQGKNYYPMETRGDSDRLELLNDSFGGLKGARIVQKREGPTGALVVRPFTDTMSRYIERATDYSSFSNLSDELELMSKGNDSVTKKIEGKFGNYFSKWMSEYVNDLNGKPKEGNKFAGLRSNLASAALTLNGGVALKQSPSYWDAAGIIDYGILVKHAPGLLKTAKSFDNNPLLEEVNQRTGMLSNRKLGYNAVEVGEATENGRTLTNKVNKILPNWATNWINKTDYRTTSNLMLACAEQATHDGYKAGTDEYYSYIANKFEQVLMKSQPIYTKQARAAYLRTGNDLTRTLAMFRTQQTQNFNNLIEAIGEYRNAKGEAKTEASKHLTQVVAGQVTGSIMFGILSAVARAGLHKWDDFEDDEGNFNVGKTASRIGLNILGSAAGTVWFGGELFNYAVDKASNTYAAAYNKAHEEEIEAGELSKKKGTGESYTFGDNALSLIDDIRSASIAFSKNPSPKNMANVVFNISQAFGVPLKNGYNMVNAVAMAALDVDRMLTGGSARNNGSTNDIFKYFSEYASKSDSQKAKLTVDAAARAYKKGHDSKAETMMSTLDYEDESVKKAVAKELNNQYVFGTLTTDQYKKLLKNYLKSENVTATVRGMDNAKKYFDSHTEKEVAADKKAIDANHNGTLTQEELYNFWLDNRSRNSTVEAFWNTNGFTGANALWETYKQNKLKNADYDKLVLDNADNPDFLKAIENAKKLESDNSFYIQTQKGDEAIFDQIVSLHMSDRESDILVDQYVSSKNVNNYNVIRNKGLSTKQAVDILKAVDALGEDESKSNGSISQKELVAYYKAHPEMEYVVEALWNAQGYTKKGKPNLWDKTKAK